MQSFPKPSRARLFDLIVLLTPLLSGLASAAPDRPNILFAISDDQSWRHTGAYGCEGIETPAFDRLAREGVLFRNAFAPSPGCSPTRAAFLTGRHIWQIEHAGTHASSFPKKYHSYTFLLEEAGYFVGGTGKLWSPGRSPEWPHNPVGKSWNKLKRKPPAKSMSSNDYAANFRDFLAARPKDKPFHFWYGASEPHRGFEKGAGLRLGKKLSDAEVPPFLPDTPEIRSDILDYYIEIEWFDTHLHRMIQALEEAGELENTLIVSTSDNGMAFPRAKANLYEYGTHMPLVIRWGARIPPGRTVDDRVGFVDLTATLLDAAQVKHPGGEFPLAGRSFLDILQSNKSGQVDPTRDAVFCGRERHSSSRWHSLGYPQRSIRTATHLYIWNPKPERWPAGTPQKLNGRPHDGYHDIDACPSLSFLIAKADDPELGKYLDWSVALRPEVELFDIVKDPGCLNNLAGKAETKEKQAELKDRLMKKLKTTGDPRVHGNGDIFETYRRYSHLRKFPKPVWAEKHPEWIPKQDWINP